MAVIAVIAGSIAYGFLPILTKNLLSHSFSAASIVFYRFFFTALTCLIIILFTKKSLKVTLRQFIEMMFFGIIGVGLTMFFITKALSYISAGVTNMIHFGYPVVVMTFMALVFKEKITVYKIISIILAITGIILLTRISEVESINGIIYALLTTITYSSYMIANKKASFASLDTIVILFYISAALSVLFFGQALITNNFQFENSFYIWANLLTMALGCTVFSLGLLMYGIKKLGSSMASILNMFEPTTTVIAAIFIYNDPLTFNIFLGSSLIILSTISMVAGSYKNI